MSPLAALLVAALLGAAPPEPGAKGVAPPGDPDADVVAHLELLERLEMLQHLDVLVPLPPAAGEPRKEPGPPPESGRPAPVPGPASPSGPGRSGSGTGYRAVEASMPQAALRSWPPE